MKSKADIKAISVRAKRKSSAAPSRQHGPQLLTGAARPGKAFMRYLANLKAPLTKNNVLAAIALTQNAVSEQKLIRFFHGHPQTNMPVLREHLSALAEEKLIVAERLKGEQSSPKWVSAEPWGDIARARIGTGFRKRRVPVKLLSLPKDFQAAASISNAELYRHQLKAGDQVWLKLSRDNFRPSIGGKVIEREGTSAFALTATYNKQFGKAQPIESMFKSLYTLTSQVTEETPRRFVIKLEPDLDLSRPQGTLAPDQRQDMKTGQDIGDIFVRKFKIRMEYPDEVLAEAEDLAKRPIDMRQRVDLTHLPFYTVDPEGATDLDDAFYDVKHADGFIRYIAISDVPARIPTNGKVFAEAMARGESYYLGKNKVIHMLPPVLGAGECSLLANQERAVIVIRQEFNLDGQPKNAGGAPDIFSAKIRSRQQLTYEQFDALMDADDASVAATKELHEKMLMLGSYRSADGELRENSSDFVSGSIIETMMVQANSMVAKMLSGLNGKYLRRNFNEEAPAGEINRAYYSPNDKGHAYLGLRYYAHFTSPARRAADILTQLALHEHFGTPGIVYPDNMKRGLSKRATHFNHCRWRGKAAERGIENHNMIYNLAPRVGQTLKATIHQIGKDFIDVDLYRQGAPRKRIPLRNLPEQWKIDSSTRELVGHGPDGAEIRRLKQGDIVATVLQDIDLENSTFHLTLEPPRPLFRRKKHPDLPALAV